MHTPELGTNSSINQLQALKDLAQGFVVMFHNLRAPAIGEIVVGVGLLPVIIRPNCIHPDNDILLWKVLKEKGGEK